jgi:proline iminopeptidase
MLFPDAWEAFLAPIPEAERGDLIAAYHRASPATTRACAAEAARAWSMWETPASAGRRRGMSLAHCDDLDFTLAFARIECHYFVNHGFLERRAAAPGPTSAVKIRTSRP